MMRFETDAIGLPALILLAKRAPAATFGIALQSLGFVPAWIPSRQRWWPFAASRGGEVALAAVVLFLIGNQTRISAEEQLLRETLGAQFEDYARRVPAFLPQPWR